MTPSPEDLSILGGNNNVVPLLPRPTVELEFNNITCNVNVFIANKLRIENKEILKGVSGCFKPGQLTAIMGPSGAGKTTLLNILAGYSTRGAKGEISVNGICACASKSTGRGGARYIRQHDDLREHLTVYEAMSLAAALKLADFNAHERKEKVHEILALLGLSNASLTLCRDLSGGQRRRLAVALELLSDPSLMFLDEPTTTGSCISSTRPHQCWRAECTCRIRMVLVPVSRPQIPQTRGSCQTCLVLYSSWVLTPVERVGFRYLNIIS